MCGELLMSTPSVPTIVRNGSRKSYVVIDHDTTDDPRLSARALGFLVYILGKPNNWEVRAEELAKRFGCGRNYAYATLAEVVDLGYAARLPVREGGRFVRWDLVIYESPTAPNVQIGESCPDPCFPDVVKPDVVNPHATKERKDLLSNKTKTFVQPDLNGDPEAAPPTPWPTPLEGVRRLLDQLEAPSGFYDLAFWQQIHIAYEPIPDVFYVDELRKYLVWWHRQPPSRRRKAVTRSFASWLRGEEAKAAARAERKVSTNGFHPQPLR